VLHNHTILKCVVLTSWAVTDDGREIVFPTVFIVLRSRASYGELAMSDPSLLLLSQLHNILSLPVFPKGGGTS
jgi:hypothetical protein